jgi:hypothetical protein
MLTEKESRVSTVTLHRSAIVSFHQGGGMELKLNGGLSSLLAGCLRRKARTLGSVRPNRSGARASGTARVRKRQTARVHRGAGCSGRRVAGVGIGRRVVLKGRGNPPRACWLAPGKRESGFLQVV